MKIKFAAANLPKSGVLVLLVDKETGLGDFAKSVDKATKGQVSRAIAAANFDAGANDNLDIVAPEGVSVSRIVLYGLGDSSDMDVKAAELIGGGIVGQMGKLKLKSFAVGCDLADGAMVAAIASGMRLRNYRFDVHKTIFKEAAKITLESASILTSQAAKVRKIYADFEAVASGVHMARDLVNEPANFLFPVEFAKRAKDLSKLGLKVEILTPAQMKKLGMEALLGVAQGSAHEARMAVMIWQGGKKGDAPLAFVGKGVTFDTGGISIKPSAGMEDMKGDMGGAACVFGLMAALAARKAKVNAVGVIGMVENMPDGKAQRPGDVVGSMSGQTIAVLNTDAEGRLVLADALYYTQDRFKPKFMINLATLTGAVLVALGKEHAGLMSNNDELSSRLSEAGTTTGEKVWRLPLDPAYDKMIDSEVADMQNIGGRYAGSITAGQFLQRFVNHVPWAHLDIAGTAMGSPKTAINQSWSSGWGVRLLNNLVATHYEGK